MIELRTDDYSDKFYKMLVEITTALKIDGVSEQDIWDVAKESDSVPHMANIGLGLMVNKIEDFCRNHFIEASSFINAMDSHLYIDEEPVRDLGGFLNAAVESQFKNPDFMVALTQEIQDLGELGIELDDATIKDYFMSVVVVSGDENEVLTQHLNSSIEQMALKIFEEMPKPNTAMKI